MEFQWPGNLALLLVVAGLVVVYVLMQRRRQKYALRYSSLLLVREAMGRGPGIRRHIPPALFLLGFTVLVFALARPAMLIKVPGLEGTVILAMDVSGSMLADDVKPNRMEAAKQAAKTFVDRQRQAKNNVRVGIVSFSDNAQIILAPTLDYVAINDALDRLKPEKATAIGRAIIMSVDAIFEGTDKGINPNKGDDVTGAVASNVPGRSPRPVPSPLPKGQFAAATVVLLTDGENNISPPPLDVIQEAVLRGIRVYTVGVGTPEGAIVTNQGRSARSELDETTLKKIAEASEAKYYNAQTESDLQQIYEQLATELVLRDERTEITVFFAALAAALLLLAGCFSLLWFSRLP
jgi:Ca-activated chloride channel family protein